MQAVDLEAPVAGVGNLALDDQCLVWGQVVEAEEELGDLQPSRDVDLGAEGVVFLAVPGGAHVLVPEHEGTLGQVQRLVQAGLVGRRRLRVS